MLTVSWNDAFDKIHAPGARLPSKGDARLTPLGAFPILTPRFELRPGQRVFTIGSCFARHIEKRLTGFDLPTRRFAAPSEEWPYAPNGLLGEFNPGTMAQRILTALEKRDFGDNGLVDLPSGATVDLLLRSGAAPVSRTRAVERRAEIDAIYAELPTSDATIITLGLVEAWFDRATGLYLNQMPPISALRSEPDRYELRALDEVDCFALLEGALGALIESGMRRIVVTVSPVPMNTTFSGRDCMIANSASKAALRSCADRLCRRWPEVDYFPSFEIVMSGGAASFEDDHVHVRDEVVSAVVRHLLDAYVPESKITSRISRE
ncbi:MAG TPA: GSCFA domain-containing protein [Caulobacterales bacterium]|nr:GSCFA domain-containing protein [Caulobacterales bacterium]